MESNGDLADADWLAARIEADHERILERYREQMTASGNALVQDDEALAQAMTNAGQVLEDVAASLRAGRVRIGDGYQAIAWDIGLTRAARGVNPGASLQSASLMFRTVLDAVARVLEERPEAFGLIVTATVALERSIMLRVRTAIAGYTGFLLNQIHDAQVTERRRIARDLHDRIGHSISVTHRQLELFDMYSEVDSGKASQKVEAAQRAVVESMQHLRAFTSDLYEFHSLKSLESALKQYVDSGAGEGAHPDPGRGDESWAAPEIVDEVFLVLREAARNALRHGSPSTIVINVDITPQELRAFVEDDGEGFDVHDRGDGFGISSMRERARLLGGTLHLRSRMGKGTHVDLVIPLEGRDAGDVAGR
ncbi:sensor histidine kinase [Catenulispora yoronensis]